MEKILVIGCPGAGKTTFVNKFGALLGIPVHHLDKYFWKENWKPTPQDEFRKIQNELMSESKWILDGNFTKSIDNRLVNADTVIFFDFHKSILVWRILKRFFVNLGSVRHDMGGENKESLVSLFKLLKFVVGYPAKEVHAMLRPLPSDKKIIILHNSEEVAQFLENI